MLHTLGVMSYSPPLDARIRRNEMIEPGHSWEVQIRGLSQLIFNYSYFLLIADIGCTIHAVELIRQQILRKHPDAEVNAILIDFFLYDTMKEMEHDADLDIIPHHRTRSIWY